jgi:hypothetical protein
MDETTSWILPGPLVENSLQDVHVFRISRLPRLALMLARISSSRVCIDLHFRLVPSKRRASPCRQFYFLRQAMQ